MCADSQMDGCVQLEDRSFPLCELKTFAEAFHAGVEIK